jgi:hypothetical protein
MAYDIAGSQILAQPVSGFMQGRALRLAERRAEQEGRALELSMQRAQGQEGRAQAEEARTQTVFDETMKQRNTEVLYRALSQIEAADDPVAAAAAMAQSPDIGGMFKQMGKDPLEPIKGKTPDQVRAMAREGRMKLAPFVTGKEEEAYTLKPGEARFRGDQKIAAVEADEEWTAPEPVVVGGKEVLAQVNKRTGQPRVVPGVAPPAKDKAGEKDKTFEHANVLRDEYNTQSKDFRTVEDSYSTITSLAQKPSAAGDIGLLTSYMRMVDPGSTVREGEFATAENAGGVPSRVRARYNNLLRGERLSEDQRKDFVGQARNMYSARKEQWGKVRSRYSDLAQRANVNPADVVGTDDAIPVTDQGPAKIASDADYAKLPAGTRYIGPDGKLRQKR